MKKKHLTPALTVLLTAGMMSTTALAADYPDVKDTDWFAAYVQDVSNSNFMKGYADGNFGAYDNLARGQFATILYRMEHEPEVSYSKMFPDVADEQFYTLPAEWAGSQKIITGYSDGNFGPADEITREQLVTIMYRYAQLNGEEVSEKADYSNFPDSASVSDFASEGMQWAIAKEIIKGTGEGKLEPQGTVSRAVCATMISRYTHGEIVTEDTAKEEPNENQTENSNVDESMELTPYIGQDVYEANKYFEGMKEEVINNLINFSNGCISLASYSHTNTFIDSIAIFDETPYTLEHIRYGMNFDEAIQSLIDRGWQKQESADDAHLLLTNGSKYKLFVSDNTSDGYVDWIHYTSY